MQRPSAMSQSKQFWSSRCLPRRQNRWSPALETHFKVGFSLVPSVPSLTSTKEELVATALPKCQWRASNDRANNNKKSCRTGGQKLTKTWGQGGWAKASEQGERCRSLPSCLPGFVSLYDLHSGLLLALAACSWLLLAALSPKLVSLYDFHSGQLLAPAACSWLLLAALSPKLVSLHDLHSGLLLAAAAALSPKLVSLYDFLSGLLLAGPVALSLFMVSLLGCSWLPLPRYLPSWFPFWTALGCRCRLLVAAAAILSPEPVSLHDFPSGLLLVAAATFSSKLSPFLISLLGYSCLPQPPSLPCWSPFLISFLGCSWLPLPPCLLACFPSWFLCNGIFFEKECHTIHVRRWKTKQASCCNFCCFCYCFCSCSGSCCCCYSCCSSW